MDKKVKKAWWQPALLLSAQVTGWIVGPIIIALFVGKALDRKYESEPWFFLGLTFVAFFISISGVVIITIKYIKQIEKEAKIKKLKKEKNERRNNQ